MRRAVFLDRDGVLVEDVGLLVDPDELRILPGVPEALAALAGGGFVLIVVSNQTVVARGLASEADVRTMNRRLDSHLRAAGAAGLDAFYFCPHHPQADDARYRCDCTCRKPHPGLLLRAADEHGIDLAGSFMVGDRVTDVIAGHEAGCRTVQVLCGRHRDPPIVAAPPVDPAHRADRVLPDLAAAAAWILEQP